MKGMRPASTRRRLLTLFRRLLRHFGPQRWWPARTRIEVIVGAILTQNTSWANVTRAIRAMRAERLLSARSIDRAPTRTLARAIRSSGYYNIKATRLKQFARFLLARYRGSLVRMFRTDVLSLRKELLSVSGVGEETADSILLYAGDRPILVVDAYTRRVLERHRLIPKRSSYGEIQRFLMDHLPLDATLFNEFHALLVAVGKEFCRTVPRCERCPLRYDLPDDIIPSGGPRAGYTRPRRR
jgi:endonuclease-3 related protein